MSNFLSDESLDTVVVKIYFLFLNRMGIYFDLSTAYMSATRLHNKLRCPTACKCSNGGVSSSFITE